jgi:phosphatidylglycerol lysyltransferase
LKAALVNFRAAFHSHRPLLAAVVGLSLFIFALAMLHHELAPIHLSDIRQALYQVPASGLLLAALGTLGSYLALTGYDVMALRYLGHALPYPRVALNSFIATTVGHNLGMALFSAGAVRLRLYTAAGLSATEVAGLTALIGLTFGVGVVFAAGLALLLEPAEVGQLLHLSADSGRFIGALLLILVAAYLSIGLLRRPAIRLGNWQWHLPGTGIALGQLILAAADLSCAAAALFWLLPGDAPVSFPMFLGVYVLAVVAGIVSHVPAGLGVFETVLLLALPDVPRDSLLAAILAYRAIYYLAPLAMAAMLAVGVLVHARRTALAQGLDRARQVFGWMAPMTVSSAVFIVGALLLFSGSTPALPERLSLLQDFVPLPLLEVSHLTGSLAGLGLVILARALYRRVDAAYHLAFWLLALGAVASLIKGLDYEEALLSMLVLGILWLGREVFNRPASLFARSFSPGWILSVGLLLVATLWLGVFSFKHLDYSQELWWQFALHGDAPRFLRASLVLVLTGAGLALMHLLRPAPPEPGRPDEKDMARVTRIVVDAPQTGAALALLGDKRLLFDPAGEAFIMYQVRGQSWIAMGDPVGPGSAREALAWRFREMADRHGGNAVFYQVDAENLPLYLDLGLATMKLGEEGVVPLAGFSLEGSARKELRQTHRRAQRDGLSFEVVPPAAVPALMDELRQVSDAWLAEKRTREKGFALGYFQPAYLAHFPCALVRLNGRIVAFANVLASAGRREMSIDLMRHRPEAPKGIMDYLFIELMLKGACEGYGQFNLGMAPLSGLESHPLAPLWHRLGTLIFQHGEHFYNFEGLRAYKNKFAPVWRPKYLAAPGGLGLPSVLLDVAALIAGGIKGVFGR